MDLSISQSQPDPRLGYGPPPLGFHFSRALAWSRRSRRAAKADGTSPKLAAEGRRQRRRAASAEWFADFIGADSSAGLEVHGASAL